MKKRWVWGKGGPRQIVGGNIIKEGNRNSTDWNSYLGCFDFEHKLPLFHSQRHLWPSYFKLVGQPAPEKLRGMPDFLVISPARTGTTWLAEQLRQQPGTYVAPEKEIHYFSERWRRHDINWYLDHFLQSAESIKGDITPSYVYLPEPVIQLIHQLNPELKLIFLARRPVEQTWSHTRHCFVNREAAFRYCGIPRTSSPARLLRESVSRHFGISGTRPPSQLVLKYFLSDYALSASDYPGALRRWLRYFQRQQFHVRYFEDAIASPEAYLSDLFSFLGITRSAPVSSTDLARGINSGVALTMPEWAHSVLADIHADRQRHAEEFLAENFGLHSPWAPLHRPERTTPLWLRDVSDQWRIYFYRGIFHALPIPRAPQDPLSLVEVLATSPESSGAVRNQFPGDLIHTLRRDRAAIPPRHGLGGDPESARLVNLLNGLHRDLKFARRKLRGAGGYEPRIIEKHRGFNIVAFAGRIYGLRESVGKIDLLVEHQLLLRRSGANDVIIGVSAEEVKSRIDSMELARTTSILEDRLQAVEGLLTRIHAANQSPGGIVETIFGFNVVWQGGRAYGLRTSLGPVDLTQDDESLTRRYSPDDLVIGDSVEAVRMRIALSEILRQVKNEIRNAEERWGEGMTQQQKEIRAAAEQQETRWKGYLQSLLEGQEASRQWDLQALSNRQEKLEAEWQERGRRQDEAERQFRDTLSKQASQAEAAVQGLAATVEGLADRIQTEAQKLKETVGEMESRLDEMQYGTGDRTVPRLLETYRNFQLIRQDDKVYAIPEVGAVNTPVIDSSSPDIAKARIDAYLAEQLIRQILEKRQQSLLRSLFSKKRG